MSNVAPQDGIDPNVNVPPAVRAAGARAEELLKQSLGPQTPAEEVQDKPQDKPQEAAPASAQEAPKPAPQEPVDWEHRYNSMKGRFERSELARQQMAAQQQELQRQFAALQAQKPAQSDVRFQPQKLVTPQEEADFGQDFLNVVGKKAKEEVSPEIARLEAELEELRGRVGGVDSLVQMTARDRMLAHLSNAVPTWEELNTNQDFLAWLDLPDPYSGAIRKQLLHAAFHNNDAVRVAAFFKGFISDEAATNPAVAGAGQNGAPGVTPVGNEPKPSPKVPLETFAAPGRAKTAAASAPAEKPFFTRAQIAAFYADVQKGSYAGRDADRQKAEQAIFEAQREGRIR